MTYEEKTKTARYLARVFFEYEEGLAISEKPSDLSWSFVYGMAKKHSVTALIYEALRERIKSEAPSELYSDWSRDASIAGARHIAQRAELEILSAQFSENKIPFLPLKGFLIKEFYKNPALREMTDIDIFVGVENLEKIEEILNKRGYTQDMCLEVHDCYKRPPFIEIELHKILHLDIKDYSMSDTAQKGDNTYHRLMTEEDFFIFLLHHAKKHDETGGAGIRTVFDFYLILKSGRFDEKALMPRIKRENLLEFYENLTALIELWFYGKRETPALRDFEIYTVTGGTYGNLENAYLRKTRKKGRFALVMERLFPPYKTMSIRYPVLKKCPILLPIFYVVRIITSVFDGSAKKNAKAVRGASKKQKELEKLAKENESKS